MNLQSSCWRFERLARSLRNSCKRWGKLAMLTRHEKTMMRLWWAENGGTVLGLFVWAAFLIETASVLSLAQGDVVRPYRIEFVEGGFSVLAAASDDACVAEASPSIACISPQESYGTR